MNFKKGDKVLAGGIPKRFTVLQSDDEQIVEIDMKTIIDGRVVLETMLVDKDSLRLAPEYAFEQAVREMRELQKAFFKDTRNMDVLSRAKAAEKRVDTLLSEMDSPQEKLL